MALFFFALFVLSVLAIDKTIQVDCAQGTTNGVTSRNCDLYGVTLNGIVNPNVHCQDKDTLIFNLTANVRSFTIFKTVGSSTVPLSGVNNNGGSGGTTPGTVTIVCNKDDAIVPPSIRFPLSYKGSNSTSISGTLCVGAGACAAQICTASTCWGDTLPNPTLGSVVAYIQALKADFAYRLFVQDLAQSFTWGQVTSDTSSSYTIIAISYSTRSETALRTALISELEARTGVTGWFTVSATSLTIVDPRNAPPPPALGGYIDILFFYETATSTYNRGLSTACRIHSECSYYGRGRGCGGYIDSNIVGEYSGNNHVQEGQCVAGPTTDWAYIAVTIDDSRESGSFKAGCNSDCTICTLNRSFRGDECSCWLGPVGVGTPVPPVYCVSVKYASSSMVFPSLLVFALILSFFSA